MAFRIEQEYDLIIEQCDNKEFLSTDENNRLLKLFLQAKQNGGYNRIVYQKDCGYQTLVKKARNIKRVDDYFKKDLLSLTEDDILEYRNLLNTDKVFKKKTLIVWENKRPKYKIENTNNPLSYRSKCDYKTNFCDFYRFALEENYKRTGNDLKDITRFFILKRPSDYSEYKVDFIPMDDLQTLLNNIKNGDLKAMIQLSVMSGARPCEIINVRYGKGNNLYKNSKGKWIIHLPKIKRISYKKFPFEIDMFEDELSPYFDNLKINEGDRVFKTTDKTFRKLMKHYSSKYLNHTYAPKILRKTARMIRTNAGYSHDWINKLMGHAPGSQVQGHYTNYEGIENDTEANDKLKAQQYPGLKKDYEQMKLKMQAQEDKLKSMEESIAQIVAKKFKEINEGKNY